MSKDKYAIRKVVRNPDVQIIDEKTAVVVLLTGMYNGVGLP